MRAREFILESDDDDHRGQLDKTGFWGRAAAGSILYSRSTGRFCLAHRSPSVLEPNTWGMWGGAMDSGESPEDAARRELVEETGYTGSAEFHPLWTFEHSSGFRYYNFLALVDREFSPKMDWETQGYKWFDLRDKDSWPSPLHPGVKTLLSRQDVVDRLSSLKPDRQGVSESLDQPYTLQWYPTNWSEGNLKIINALAKLTDGTILGIMFDRDSTKYDHWHVQFDRDGDQEITGEGDQQRVFATVLSAIKTFVEQRQPRMVYFSAVKSLDFRGTRTRLYDRLVQRYATQLGYKITREEHIDSTEYYLMKARKTKQQGVAEGLNNVPLTLYHATYSPLLKSINQHGLGGDKAQPNWEDSKPGVVYLALDKNVAKSYAEASDVVPDDWIDKIVILKIATAGLDPNKFNIDSNVQDNEGDTLEYHGIIPVSNIEIVKQDVAESLRVDVPNEEWLQGKIAYAKKKGRDRFGVPNFNATTAYYRPDVRVPIEILRRLPGMRGEQQNIRQQDLQAIKKILKDTGRLPLNNYGQEYVPFVMVAYNGEAWVNEGNHRIMAAAELYDAGDERFASLPIELKYFDGGERVKSGPLHPSKISQQAVSEGLAKPSLEKIIQSFVNSEIGQKYKTYDCKTVTRAFVNWAEQNQISTQVISLAPPSADFIKQNPQFGGKRGEGNGHIMPIVNNNAIDFTVRQFGVNRPFERPLVTPVSNLKSVYGRFGYFTDRPEWFLGGKTHWVGSLSQIPPSIFNQNFGDELLEQHLEENFVNKVIQESFDQPYPIVWNQGEYGDVDGFTTLADGSRLELLFNLEDKESKQWMFQFYRDDRDDVSGQGDAQRVFATVLSALKIFLRRRRPNMLHFSASREVDSGQKAQSRSNLYTRLMQRYAPTWGYNVEIYDDGGRRVDYVLTPKVKQKTNENFADGKNPGRRGLSRRVGIPKKATLGQLEKIAKSSTGERRRMAQWQLNMRRGRARKGK